MDELIQSLTAIYQEEKYIFDGPKSVEFQLDSGIDVHIEQMGIRTIQIKSESATVQDLYSVLTKLERLLMLFDGRFFSLYKLQLTPKDDSRNVYLQSISNNILCSRLKYFDSDDMYKDSLIHLVDYTEVLTSQLYCTWCELLEELDTINQMYLYASSNCGLTKDVTCAFLIELAESLVEIIKMKKNMFADLHPGSRGTSLADCIKGLIQAFGSDIFSREIYTKFDDFIKVAVYSRVKIMHIKKTSTDKTAFNGRESVLYGMKFNLLYRRIMFELLGIPEEAYSESLLKIVKAYDKWNGILDQFLTKL